MSRARLRVLHVSAYFAPAFRYGGPPRSILGLCQALGRADVDVEVFTTTANGDEPLTPAPAGVAFEGVRVRYFPLVSSIGWRASGLAAAVARAARAADAIHVHGLWNMTAWAGVRAAAAARIPYVISPRGMLQPEAMARRSAAKSVAYRVIERRNLERAALLHATSDAEAATLARVGPRVALIPNGVAVETPAPAAIDAIVRRLNVPPGASVVAFIGRLHPIKRLDLLADAFTRLRHVGSDAYLAIAGPDEGGHRRTIEPLFAAAADRVRWLGTVTGAEKWALLHASRVLVQCSDSESFGLSVAEALSAGVPAVVTDRGAWKQLAAVGAGLVVAHDGGAIAAALRRLVADPTAARQMGERGRAWAARTFGWDAIGYAMRREYESIAPRQVVAAS